LLNDLIKCREDEISVLKVDDRTHALNSGADCQANKAGF